MILDFYNDMKNLQEHIIKKSNNLKEFKKKFEINKKNIKIFCEKILKNRNSPEKIKDIKIKDINIKNIKTKQNENYNIHKMENEIKEKDIKIKRLEEEISKYISKNKELMNKINEREINKKNGNEEIKKEIKNNDKKLESTEDKNLNQTNINIIYCIYFNKDKKGTWCKNLSSLKELYRDEEKSYKFLKQYLVLNRSEIFFADKIILIEGDTERILLPAMLKKIDDLTEETDEKLLSQNISIIEIGRHSKIFEHFLEFLQIKTLVITDIDSTKKKINDKGNTVYCACEVENPEASRTSNDSIKHYLKNYITNDECLEEIKSLKTTDKILVKTDSGWVKDENGIIMIQYQLKEESAGYYPRSFELIHV